VIDLVAAAADVVVVDDDEDDDDSMDVLVDCSSRIPPISFGFSSVSSVHFVCLEYVLMICSLLAPAPTSVSLPPLGSLFLCVIGMIIEIAYSTALAILHLMISVFCVVLALEWSRMTKKLVDRMLFGNQLQCLQNCRNCHDCHDWMTCMLDCFGCFCRCG
jgi:hypothetical protein